MGATAGALVGSAVGVGAGLGAKLALGEDKVALATTLGGAAGAVVGAGIGELKARRSMKIYATQINIKTNNSTITDNYNPEYIGTLNKNRLSEIFDRECPYNRDVFNKLFSPIKTRLQTQLQTMTGNPYLLLFRTDGMFWNSNDDNSRAFLTGLITCCIYVKSDSNTLIISVITGDYFKNGHLFFTEVIPSYYLVPNMTACIQQNNPLVETKVSDAFSLYAEFSETETDDDTCPISQINRGLHQEPELDRWIIPRKVQINII